MALDLALSSSSQMQKPGRWVRVAQRAWSSWATRSLAIGGIATAIDVAVLLFCVNVLGTSNSIGAMAGVVPGATFTFFANRHFAFRDHDAKAAPQALKFFAATSISMLLHGLLVGVLADRLRVPVVLAKFASDLLIFSVGQLFVLRYLVFPKAKSATPAVDVATDPAAASDVT